jgi:uncharacterized protein (TIGR02118 family)
MQNRVGNSPVFVLNRRTPRMVKFMILFRKPTDLDAFERRYNEFLALIERMPDIERRQVISILGSPLGEARYYRILEIYFSDTPRMEASLRSKAGQEAGGDLTKRFPKDTFDVIFAEVYEEAGGSTPTG